jgi:uncharacterized repeat protein (TIGR03803 family)
MLSQRSTFQKNKEVNVNKLRLWRTICLVCVFCAVAAIGSSAQTFKTLVSFNGTDGQNPALGSLVQGLDGNFYGTTFFGGANGDYVGTVFKITPSGKLTTLYSFCAQSNCTDGENPEAGLVLATDGNFYGTATFGGPNCEPGGCGTVFKITPAGKLTTLHSFGYDGAYPYAGLVQATDENFYGTAEEGGASGWGIVFKITPAGKLTTLASFCLPGCADGSSPHAGLVQATDGNFYGTTYYGGTNCTSNFNLGCGTVFKVTPAGKLTTLHSFCADTGCADGFHPQAGLVQATDGNLYGTTQLGGGCDIAYDCGTVFKITPAGKLTTLHRFSYSDGYQPTGGLVQATDGNLYGTTGGGGANSGGTVFKITPTGALNTLHSFDGTDGHAPVAGLVQATDGNFYGTTDGGGVNGDGTVFRLSVGLGPFVSFVHGTAKVGKIVDILGQGLSGTTSVSFNGTSAVFKVKGDTFVKATVPAGATTGAVTVKTPGGTLTSNLPFRVRPQILSFSPTSGPVGTPVTITGVSLTQTKEVIFCGAQASFAVDSDTQVTTTVPAGAHGSIQIAITTAGGKTWSTQDFTVTQ